MKNRFLTYAEKVEIGGKEYDINTDFSVWIEIEQLLIYSDGDYGSRLAKVLSLAYAVLPEDPKGAVEKVLWFYALGREPENSGYDLPPAPVFDLMEDFEYIRAGFLSEFGIDLLETNMHWWQFRKLLSCLGEDSKFSKIVAYRTTDTAKIKNREARLFFERMKKKYKLKDRRSPEERETETALKLETLFS